MDNDFCFKKEVKKIGSSKVIILPKELAEELDLDFDTKIKLGINKGKYGKFIWIAKLKQEVD